MTFAILFAMLFNLVYSMYCKMCDHLKGYQDTDLVSLSKVWGRCIQVNRASKSVSLYWS